MTQQERQQREIESIKPRQFMLNLSDADITRIYSLAYSSGTTPAEILEGFIMDLVSGTYTHGSDERDLARSYFERCNYSMAMQRTFLTWLLNDCRIDEIADILETLQFAAGDLSYYAENPADPDGTPDLIADLKQTEAEAQEAIAALYREYAEEQERQRRPTQDMQEGIEAVKAYLQELQTMGAE